MATIQERKSRDGKTTYRVQVRLKGHPIQSATFDRKTDAKKWAVNTESAIREGRHFKTSAAKKHTLANLIQRYIDQILPTKPKSQYKQSIQLKWWSDQIGSYTLADVTPALIGEQRDKLLNSNTSRGTPRNPATVNRYLAALSHALNIAVKDWGWLETNPMTKLRKLKEARGIVRYLDDDERPRLLEACKQGSNPYLYIIVVLCISTGARKNEILSLTWKDVDLDRAIITLHETKNGERRILPITGHALDILSAHAKVRRIDTDLLFPNNAGDKPIDIRAPWEAALKKADIENFRFHDLRHSAASYLAMNGATLAEIAEVLGHKTLQMVKRYAHLSEAHTAKIVGKMNESIFG